jgi:pimeloyl-ACP methyl ester carboxylesterase
MKALSMERDVIAIELKGQGLTAPYQNGLLPPASPFPVPSLADHARDLATAISEITPCAQVDVVGVSFGGRVALTLASNPPLVAASAEPSSEATPLLRKAVLVGVGAARSAHASSVLAEFERKLYDAYASKTDSKQALEEYFSQAMEHVFGHSFLRANASRLPGWARQSATSNTIEGVLSVLRVKESCEGLAEQAARRGVNVRAMIGSEVMPLNFLHLLVIKIYQ